MRCIETEALPTCERFRMGVIPWSPLAGGWLSGRFRKGGDVTSRPPHLDDPASRRR